MVKQYETTFIVDAHLQTEQIEKTVSKYSQLIEKASGKIKLIDRWGKRRLAYEIARKQYGYYVYVRFEAPGAIVDTLEKEFKLDETILRYLVLRVPKVVLREEEKKPLKQTSAGEAEDTEKVVKSEKGEEPDTEEPDAEKPVDEKTAASKEDEPEESESGTEKTDDKAPAEDA